MTAPQRGPRPLPRTENVHMGQNDHFPSSRYSCRTTLWAEEGTEARVEVGVAPHHSQRPRSKTLGLLRNRPAAGSQRRGRDPLRDPTPPADLAPAPGGVPDCGPTTRGSATPPMWSFHITIPEKSAAAEHHARPQATSCSACPSPCQPAPRHSAQALCYYNY